MGQVFIYSFPVWVWVKFAQWTKFNCSVKLSFSYLSNFILGQVWVMGQNILSLECMIWIMDQVWVAGKVRFRFDWGQVLIFGRVKFMGWFRLKVKFNLEPSFGFGSSSTRAKFELSQVSWVKLGCGYKLIRVRLGLGRVDVMLVGMCRIWSD